MLSETSLRFLSDIFIGDSGALYNYKKGYELVEFFNSHFDFEDEYGQGFPSRWYYVVEKLTQLIEMERFGEFLNTILSIDYIRSENRINNVEAARLVAEVLDTINDELSIEGYSIKKIGSGYTLTYVPSDLEFVGEGGFAIVYHQHSNGRIVKKLKEEFLTDKGLCSRFKREYTITKSLDDIEGIIEVYEFDESNYSYSMEKADLSLQKFSEISSLLPNDKERLLIEILEVMTQVHKRNIIHRDISPNNILLIDGYLKLSDFGLGKDLDVFHSHRTIYTKEVGQYAYCAPEQFMKLKEGDKKSDVYSLGSLTNFIMTGDPTDKRHFLRSIVDRSRNESPNLRFEDAGEMLTNTLRTIEYQKKTEIVERVASKIDEGIYDIDVENYILQKNGEELCSEIIKNSRFRTVMIEHMSVDENRALETINLVYGYYEETCQRFEDYDNFSSLCNSILRERFQYVVKEVAAEILNAIAIDVNRFHAQRLIDNLLDWGIEPMLGDILKYD